jgi:hypothetical protein
VPFDLSADGTSASTAALPVLLDAADVELDDDGAAAELELVLADELLLLLLPHATMATALSNSSAASSGFLQVLIRLLLVETETPVRGGSE